MTQRVLDDGSAGPTVANPDDGDGTPLTAHTDGDPNIDQDGTQVNSVWLNSQQEGMCSIVELNGEVLDAANNKQPGQIVARIGDMVFGDGSSGNATVADSSTTTMTADVYAQNVTIGTNARLRLAGFRLFVSGTLTIGAGSSVDADGDDGVTAGGDRYDPLGPFYMEGGTVGATGTVNAGVAGANGGAVLNGGGSGGNGGAGAQPGGAGGTSSAMVDNAGGFRAYPDCVTMTTISSGPTTRRVGAGSSGGAGGGNGADLGGHGGAGGGVGVVCAKVIDLAPDARISANGGAGSDGGGAANTGGGGGGEGGTLALIYRTVVNGDLATQATATGGTGGAGGGVGASGGDGSDGTVILLTA